MTLHGAAYNRRNHAAPFVDRRVQSEVKSSSCGRSTVFAAGWYAHSAARNWSFDSGSVRVISERQKLLRGYAKRYTPRSRSEVFPSSTGTYPMTHLAKLCLLAATLSVVAASQTQYAIS
ncbi:MAG TPA: hypothetical protein VNI77_11330, partial [Nitrososphaera sp.]|nr:hypothetical protein [Nitrososphaera sp.]